MRKKLIALISAALAVTVSCSARSVIAAENTEMRTIADASASGEGLSALPDSKELEQMYIEKMFYGGGISLYADYGRECLTGTELAVYNDLRSHIEAVANGTETSTKFVTSVQREVTLIGSSANDAALELYAAANKALKYLIVDLPEDFYWFDKTSGWQWGVDSSPITGSAFTITLTATFDVSTDYMGANNTTVNPQKINTAKTAVANAKKIAAKYENLSAYEKILAYKKEICDLVSYNTAAAESTTSAVGINPWQLVWVFDGNPNTNVVCEGYSKAFQYLCDLGGVECYTVSGYMNGGGHMWNIVVLDGESYLADITNCDGDENSTTVSIGYPDKLLLKGASQSSASGCTFSNLGGLTYEYDTEDVTSPEYPASLLKVSDKDYTPLQSDPVFGDINGDGKFTPKDLTALGKAYMAGTADRYAAIADMDGNGRITPKDIAALGKLYMSNQQ